MTKGTDAGKPAIADAPDLRSLIERLEAATAGSKSLDLLIADELRLMVFHVTDDEVACEPYTTSIDAALTLVPAGWKIFDCEEYEPDWWSWFLDDRENPRKQESGYGRSMALALCIAALKARLADTGAA